MRLFRRASIIFLLLFNAAGAMNGGLNLIIHPDGGSLGMPLSFLHNTPFASYFVPGMVLRLANGVLGLFVLLATVLRWTHYASLVVLQGIQSIMLLIGIAILFLGMLEKRVS